MADKKPLDKDKVKEFHAALDKALKAMAQDQGFSLDPTRLTYDPGTGEIRGTVRFVLAGQESAVSNRNAESFGYSVRVGDPVVLSGRRFTVDSVSNRGKVLIKDEAGKLFKASKPETLVPEGKAQCVQCSDAHSITDMTPNADKTGYFCASCSGKGPKKEKPGFTTRPAQVLDDKAMGAVVRKEFPALTILAVGRMIHNWKLNAVLNKKPLPSTYEEVKARAEHNVKLAEENVARIPPIQGDGRTVREHALDLINESASELNAEAKAS